jgi:4-aminobutyrate aminotransferase / (S)-3-amino-2-methylpropionate transaminase / 5-aminovalerate transaminase
MTLETPVRELEQLRQYLPAAYLIHHPIVTERAEGSYVIDTDGNRYLDFAGGIAVVNVGHRHPAVAKAVHEQVDKVWHMGPVTLNEGYLRLAARLSKAAPGPSPKQALFVNSGAEAVENAVKIAREATGRQAIIAFDNSFHGRTLLTSTMTGKTHPYKVQPGSLAPEIYHAPYPYAYRPPRGVSAENLVDYCLGQLDELVRTRVPAEKVAAVIVEPVQGEGGYIVPPPGFIAGVEAFCHRIGALLIVDEIQTGFGRTGRMFAIEHEGVEPDIMAVGKSIGGGLPLAGVVAKKEVWDRVHPGDVGGTYGGNPVACAAGIAVLDVLESEGFMERGAIIAGRTRQALDAMAKTHATIGEIRGLGPMLGVELVTDRTTKEPANELTTRFIEEARTRGLIMIRTGKHGNVLRLLIPLSISDEELDSGLEIIEASLTAAEAALATA